MEIIQRKIFIEEFIIELTKCQRPYVSVHADDLTNWTAQELGSLAHDVYSDLVSRA